MNADRRAALKLGVLAFALPGLTAFAASASVTAVRFPGVAEVWGMAFWMADAGEASLGRGDHGRGQALRPPEWHPEFA